MAQHIQRKKFDHVQFALNTKEGFDDPAYIVPGVDLTAEVVEIEGAPWLYVTQVGDFDPDNVLILPDYERVA